MPFSSQSACNWFILIIRAYLIVVIGFEKAGYDNGWRGYRWHRRQAEGGSTNQLYAGTLALVLKNFVPNMSKT